MFYDLNVPYDSNSPDTAHTLHFLAELGYTTIALSQTLTGKLPPNPSPLSLPTNAPPSLTLLTRLNIILADPAQNQRLSTVAQLYSLIALRPTNEKTLSQACNSLDCDIISLDLSLRLPFHFKFKTLSAAISRGIRFEICYGPGVTGSGLEARRNLIGNAAALIRATRGRGIIISSGAKQALGFRAPWDVINLACIWGLNSEKGKEAICEETRKVVALAEMKRTSWRGTVDVVYGGEVKEGNDGKLDSISAEAERNKKANKASGLAKNGENGVKRKAVFDGHDSMSASSEPQLSKREMKRRAKKARLERGANGTDAVPSLKPS